MSWRAAAAGGWNQSSVKSRCRWRDGAAGNLDGDVEAKGVHCSGTQSCLGRRMRKTILLWHKRTVLGDESKG